ncbi:tetratricopeptide repeat protein [Hydrogenophaga sp. BPS33]|uniref:tetratricopeptide repeat protein n=1 Tax=Hydrogenophaga sp. BPS33 TaxID=2651974 RepID=UPI00131FC889|nr:tetratricopeptide repeat protein [Hydrogenophaga sp. BPS33]QHE87601.1 hypothetical protein F9K07_23235 [Hydrogenophaga sp. BPS33]
MEAVTAELNGLAPELDRLDTNTLPPGVSLGQLRGLTASTYLPVYDAARALCDQGQFQEALPLAIYLVGHEPRYQPFVFIAASCLQRMGEFAAAAELYAAAVNDGANDALAVFRMGECLETLKPRKEAGEAFFRSGPSPRPSPPAPPRSLNQSPTN